MWRARGKSKSESMSRSIDFVAVVLSSCSIPFYTTITAVACISLFIALNYRSKSLMLSCVVLSPITQWLCKTTSSMCYYFKLRRITRLRNRIRGEDSDSARKLGVNVSAGSSVIVRRASMHVVLSAARRSTGR